MASSRTIIYSTIAAVFLLERLKDGNIHVLMEAKVKAGGDIIFYGTVVIPAYIEKHAPDALNFSKPRYDIICIYCTCMLSLLWCSIRILRIRWLYYRGTGVWRTGMSTLPAAPPIKYVLGYRSRPRTLTLNPNPITDRNPIPKNKRKQNDTWIKFNIELYLKVNFLWQGLGL